MPFTLPPSLVAQLEAAAQEAGRSPAELLQGWLERDRRERGWRALMRRGQQRGAAVLASDDPDAIDDVVNAKIAESRRERRGL